MDIKVVTFYHFFPFTDYITWRAPLKAHMDRHDLKGIVLLAPEGINATVAGSEEGTQSLLELLRTHPQLHQLKTKESACSAMPFKKSKIRLKRELINMGVPASPTRGMGQNVPAGVWNKLIADESVVVLDTRNKYEVEKGTFKRAINPDIQYFKELTGYIEKHFDPASTPKIATFCTGGIRCEKLTAWMHEKGYQEVYQLQGGILQYLKDMPEEQSLWEGACFVFDEREAVTHGLKPVAHNE